MKNEVTGEYLLSLMWDATFWLAVAVGCVMVGAGVWAGMAL